MITNPKIMEVIVLIRLGKLLQHLLHMLHLFNNCKKTDVFFSNQDHSKSPYIKTAIYV